MERAQKSYLLKDLSEKFIFIGGPRQSGKTTLAKQLFPHSETQYLNYDYAQDRILMTRGEWNREAKLVILDEFHKFPKWKTFLKGFYDKEGIHPPLLVTGSARLNVFKKGNDSLIGRYFYHRLLPLSVKELSLQTQSSSSLEQILKFGNFPEPCLKQSLHFSKRWRNNYLDRILKEDLRDLSKITDLAKVQLLMDLLRERVGSTLSYASLAQTLEVAPKTVKHWIDILEQLYVVFRVLPYSKNISRSLLKEPKIYFFDCNMAFNEESHFENFVAVSLLKHLWFLEDTQGVKTQLYFLRTKDGQEVDFALVKDRKVTQLIEAKQAEFNLHKPLQYFGKFIPNAKLTQIVCKSGETRTVEKVQIESAEPFLKKLAI